MRTKAEVQYRRAIRGKTNSTVPFRSPTVSACPRKIPSICWKVRIVRGVTNGVVAAINATRDR